MKITIFAVVLMSILGCATRHAAMHPKYIQENIQNREFIGQHKNNVSIGDSEGLRQHTLHVLDEVYKKINRHDSQKSGSCFISSAWFFAQALSFDEKEKVISILKKDGYDWDIASHYNSWSGRYQEDIIITW